MSYNEAHIDIETRSTVDLKKEGLARYARSPETTVLLGVIHIGGVTFRCRTPVELVVAYNQIMSGGVTFHAHNAAFEMQVLKHRLGLDINPSQWRCSAALARSFNLPGSLENSASFLGLAEQKDMKGSKLMLKYCKPRPKNQRKDGLYYDLTPEVLADLMDYCEQDVMTEKAIFDRLGSLPDDEQDLWVKDYIMNYENGIKIDVDLCRSAKRTADKTCKDINDECFALHGFKLTQVAKVKEFCGLENTQSSTINDTIKSGECTPDVLQVLKWRQMVSNTSPKKYQAALDMEVDGRIYGTMMFNGASQTGRWSGRGFQIQNIPRGGFSELWVDEEMEVACRYIKDQRHQELIDLGFASDTMDLLKSTTRGVIVGDLAVCDYSAIEARVLAWLAGQHDVVESFRNGLDLYKVCASQVYNKPYEEITKDERQIGKVVGLACGYQGSVGAFNSMAEIYGVKVAEDDAKDIIKRWRRSNEAIVDFWYRCESDAMTAVRERTEVGMYFYEDDFLHARLPSGRTIKYFSPSIEVDNQYNKAALTFVTEPSATDKIFKTLGTGKARVFTYAGKLAQGLTQATARDVMADAMLRIPAENLRFTVHDELVVEGMSLEELKTIMLVNPKWAEGLPLAVSGDELKRYRK